MRVPVRQPADFADFLQAKNFKQMNYRLNLAMHKEFFAQLTFL